MKKAVIFDFDGVIADTHDVWLEYNRKVHDPNLTVEAFHDAFNGNYWKDKGIHEVTESDKAVLLAYQEQLVATEPFAGMPKLLNTLKEKGYLVFIVTSTMAPIVQDFLDKYKVTAVVKIMGAAEGVSKVEKTRHILENYEITEENAVFVTDTLGDVKEAKEAGIEAIAVGWGWHEVEKLKSGGPKAIVHSPAELMTVIESHLGSK